MNSAIFKANLVLTIVVQGIGCVVAESIFVLATLSGHISMFVVVTHSLVHEANLVEIL